MSKKKTNEEFIYELSQKNPDITLLGIYKSAHISEQFQCKKCKHIWTAKPNNVLNNNTGCPKCRKVQAGKNRSKTARKLFENSLKEIFPYIQILNYQGEKSYDLVDLQCTKCNHVWSMRNDIILTSVGCPDCDNQHIKTREQNRKNFYIKFKNEINPNTILLSEYKGRKKEILCTCKLHDTIEWIATPERLIQNNNTCPVCNNRKLLIGANDIETKCQNIVPFLADKNDKNTIFNTNRKLKLKCPDCGNISFKRISDFIRKGHTCQVCGDGISYPNKLCRSLLKQLPVENLHFEYNPNWIKPYYYDCYFEYKNNKFVIEMDGGFHYKDNTLSGMTYEDAKKRDLYKDQKASEHNICVIRIDCRKSEFEYIKNNIISSQLSQVLDLSNIDWNTCDLHSQNNIIKKVCDHYNEQHSSIDELSEKFKMHQATIQRYLKIGNKFGWCSYVVYNKKKSIYVYNLQGQLLYTFNSIKDCERFFNNDLNIDISYSRIQVNSKKGFTINNEYYVCRKPQEKHEAKAS